MQPSTSGPWLDRVTSGLVSPRGVELHDGCLAGEGDWLITLRNLRLVTTDGGRDFVKNGDRWTLLRLHDDGWATLIHHRHGGRVRLPSAYLARDVGLGYAATAHRAQGCTVDTAHVLVRVEDSREVLYVAKSRTRLRTMLYAVTDDEIAETPPSQPIDGHQVLERVIAREAGTPLPSRSSGGCSANR